MSLITQSLVPNALEPEPFGVVQNFFEDVMFIGPDGAATVTAFYKAFLLAGMFIQRRGSCSIYTADRETLIFEFHDGSLRGKPKVLDAVEDLLKTLNTEAGIAARAAVEKMVNVASQSSTASPTLEPARVKPADRGPEAQEASDSESGPTPVEEQHTTPNRFRRRGR